MRRKCADEAASCLIFEQKREGFGENKGILAEQSICERKPNVLLGQRRVTRPKEEISLSAGYGSTCDTWFGQLLIHSVAKNFCRPQFGENRQSNYGRFLRILIKKAYAGGTHMAKFVCGNKKWATCGVLPVLWLSLCLLTCLAFAIGTVLNGGIAESLPQMRAEECRPVVSCAKAQVGKKKTDALAATTRKTDEALSTHREEDLFPDYVMRGRLRRDTETAARNTVVRILEGESDRYYLIKSEQGDRMVVGWDELTLLPPPARVLPPVSAEQIVAAVVERGYESATDRLLWTNLYRTETYLLCREGNGWRLDRRIACSVGDDAHPTPTGRFSVSGRLAAIGKKDRYLCRHALCFHGAYMYHSVLFDPTGSAAIDGRLGARISHGCIRLSREDAAYLYANVPARTAVYIN